MNEASGMLLAQGPPALKAGSKIGTAASKDDEQTATHAKLKTALQAGARTFGQGTRRIGR